MEDRPKYAAIPTLYSGIQFRSRLEATWAAFFDILGWTWEYEPHDLNGWIPDFQIKHQIPLLVEIKPECTTEGLQSHLSEFSNSGANRVLLLGSSVRIPVKHHGDGPGLLWEIEEGSQYTQELSWCCCNNCSKTGNGMSAFPPYGAWNCIFCDHYEKHYVNDWEINIDATWAYCKNLTQWKGRA